MEEKIIKLSKLIVDYSINVQENERVLIQIYGDTPTLFVKTLIREINKKGAVANIRTSDAELSALIFESKSNSLEELVINNTKYIVDNYDSYIQIRNDDNMYEGKYIDQELIKTISQKTLAYNEIKINDRKWVLLDYPNALAAYKSAMTKDEFFNYSMDAMNADYKQMALDVKPLADLMKKTDKVRITGLNTDITFSIKDIGVVPCCGEKNLPDGEVYTAPVKNSVNGRITYNVPSNKRDITFNNVSLLFKDGKIIECSADSNVDLLNEIFDTDEGARYVGEFAIGINNNITKPSNNILFDEKIGGSIHFTPGNSYNDASNGNKSSIHWDLVFIQKCEYGGGEIYFDNILIRKDGIFVIDELKHLN